MTAHPVQSVEKSQAPQSRVAQVTQALANTRDTLEAPFRLIPQGNAFARTFGHGAHILPKAGRSDSLRHAECWLDAAPSLDELRSRWEALTQALATPASRDLARVTLGLLLSAYPNTGREPKEEYFATLLHDIIDEGIGPHVLAEACRNLRRSTRFLPTVGEVLQACENARYRLRGGIEEIERQIRMSEAAHHVLSVHSRPPSEWPEDAWWEALMQWGHSASPSHGVWNPALGPAPGEPGCLLPPEIKAAWRAMVRRDRA